MNKLMYQPAVFFIGLRYVFNRSVRFRCFFSYLSTVGITIGVMSLVTMLSVMNGFEYELKHKILSVIPQVIISSKEGSLNPHQISKNSIRREYGVNCITPITTSDVLLQSSNGVAVGVILGIDPKQKDPLTPYLINTDQYNLKAGEYNIILGWNLNKELSVNFGEQIRVIIPSVSQFTPIGRFPSQRLFNVIGTFFTDSEADNYQMLANIQDVSNLMHFPFGNITGWRLWLNEPSQVNKLSRHKLPDGVKWQDWRERKGELFQAVRMEKNIMKLLLMLVIVVSGFNIMSSLGIVVVEKQGELAILRTQGMKKYQIMIIFMVQGACLGIIGALLGSIFGTILTSQLNRLISIGMSFNSSVIVLPIKIKPLQIIYIDLASILISLFSTLYPSWRAASIKPHEILRYE